jgi:hypothetical protein
MRAPGIAVALAVLLAGCASPAPEPTESATPQTTTEAAVSTFTADVWADNWFALYINGELVGEDSVPITTERSFNKETITFTASYPLTIAIEAKDYMETESGLEYIGSDRQQLGDGGLIAQITDESGAVVAVTDDTWAALVVQRAPLDTSCERSANPDVDCASQRIDPDPDWFAVDYDAGDWMTATEFSAADVGPKEGYDEVHWDSSAALIWAGSLKQDNIILFRHVVS